MITLENIGIIFNKNTPDQNQALKNINLKINKGDFITVIGSNGAGKSTLQNVISGNYMPSTGRILLENPSGIKDMTRMPEFKRAKYLGRVFQDPMMGTAGNMEIEENLAMAYRRGKKRTLSWGIKKSEKDSRFPLQIQSVNCLRNSLLS